MTRCWTSHTGLTLTGLVAACLGGCTVLASRHFEPGSPASSVVARLGSPTGEVALPAGGKQLEYATGPFGKSTHLYRFDDQGRLLSGEEVLTERHFAAVQAGMSATEVLLLIGKPSVVWPLRFQRQNVWSYRYETSFCQWFMVGMGDDNRVVDTAYGPDPLCEVVE